MKIKTKFHPVTITLETAQEFELMWNVLEQSYLQYDKGSLMRNFLVNASNAMSEAHSFPLSEHFDQEER